MNESHNSTPRASVYLVLRSEALIGSLKFFRSESGGHLRQLQFLAQSDYWEWELDNLIYSFTNFSDRQALWNSLAETNQRLLNLGVVVEAKVLSHLHRSRHRNGWYALREEKRVAPINMLKNAIDQWNDLIDVIEKRLIFPMEKKARRWHIQTRADLTKMRKRMPELEVVADE